jgi:hypothetical protein
VQKHRFARCLTIACAGPARQPGDHGISTRICITADGQDAALLDEDGPAKRSSPSAVSVRAGRTVAAEQSTIARSTTRCPRVADATATATESPVTTVSAATDKGEKHRSATSAAAAESAVTTISTPGDIGVGFPTSSSAATETANASISADFAVSTSSSASIGAAIAAITALDQNATTAAAATVRSSVSAAAAVVAAAAAKVAAAASATTRIGTSVAAGRAAVEERTAASVWPATFAAV